MAAFASLITKNLGNVGKLTEKFGNVGELAEKATGAIEKAKKMKTQAEEIATKATGAMEEAKSVVDKATGTIQQVTGIDVTSGLPGTAPAAAPSTAPSTAPGTASTATAPAAPAVIPVPASAQESAPAASSPFSALFSKDSDGGPNVSNEEKKKKILQAYYDIIKKKESEINKKFTESLDSYIKDHFKVGNAELEKFVQKAILGQMNEFFNSINTSYVSHAFVLQIFKKHNDLLMKLLKASVQKANIISNMNDVVGNTSSVFQQFKEELTCVDMQQTIIRGGGNNVGMPTVAEIISWYPEDETKDGVNSDIKYVIEQVFVETMRKDNNIATTINDMMTKYIFPRVIEGVNQIIAKQSIDVDISILRACLENSDVHNTVITSIQNAIVTFPPENRENVADTLTPVIFKNIIDSSTKKYNDTICKKKEGGGKRKKKQTQRRRSRRRRYTQRK